MDRLFEVRKTQHKGQGLFALKAVPPGTTILRDNPIIDVPKSGNRASGVDIQHAFDNLTEAEQQVVLSLHAGNYENYDVPLLHRIHQANAFGDDDRETIYPLISRINHSCVANAFVEGNVVTSYKHIKAREEVTIDYGGNFHERMTTQQRAFHLWNNHDFECLCQLCANPKLRHISDMRRILINALMSALDGFEPETLGPPRRTLAKSTDGKYELVDADARQVPLSTPLTLPQQIEDRYLLGRLGDAEGHMPFTTANHYIQAAAMLFGQQEFAMLKNKASRALCFLDPYRCIKEWTRRAIELYESTRGSDFQMVIDLKKQWREWKQNKSIGFLLKVIEKELTGLAADHERPIAAVVNKSKRITVVVDLLTRPQREAFLKEGHEVALSAVQDGPLALDCD